MVCGKKKKLVQNIIAYLSGWLYAQQNSWTQYLWIRVLEANNRRKLNCTRASE